MDGARLIALQAAVRWLSCSIFVLQQATPNTKRGTLEMSFKKKKKKKEDIWCVLEPFKVVREQRPVHSSVCTTSLELSGLLQGRSAM